MEMCFLVWSLMAWRTGIAHVAIALPGYALSPGGSALFHYSIIDLLSN
jgi:hypothetical protein